MKLPKILKTIKTLGRLNLLFLSFVVISVILNFFSFSLYIFDFNSYIPSVLWILLSNISLVLGSILLIIKVKRHLPITHNRIEKILFSKRRFLIDAIVESYKKKTPINELDEKLEKGLNLLLKNQIIFSVLLLTSVIVFMTLFISFNTKGITEMKKFLENDVDVYYNKFISSSLPLEVKVIPKFNGDFFLYIDKVIPLAQTNGIYLGSIHTSSTNIPLFVRKYGIVKKIITLTPIYLSDLTLIDQKVEIFFKNLRISSYDHIPQIDIVRGSKIVIYLKFSHEISNVFSKPFMFQWKYSNTSNSLVISLVPKSNMVFNVEVLDVFGRRLNIGNIDVVVKQNDIPVVSIKYPEKDLTLVSKFVLEGYGEVVDNDTIVDTWMDIIVSNSLTGIVKSSKFLRGEGKGLSFKYNGEFSFILDSIKANFLPGDYIDIYVYAKDIYGAIGNNKRRIYLPTFSQIAQMMEKDLQDKKEQTLKQKDNLLQLRYDAKRGKLNPSKLSEEIETLKNFITNLSEFSEKIGEIYNQIDRTKGLSEEFEKLKNISQKLQNILNDKEFKEIVDKLSSEKTFDPEKVSRKLEDITKSITEFEMEVNRLSEFKDILKSLSQIREIEESLKRSIDDDNQNKFQNKVDEFIKSEEFNKMSDEFRDSFLEKLKQVEKSLKDKKYNNKSDVLETFKDIDFEVFKEIMKKISQMNRKQKEKFWDIYFKVLNSQILLTKSKDNIDTLSLRYAKINKDALSNEFKVVSDIIKDFRFVMLDFLKSFSLLDPSSSEVFSEIEFSVREVENEFNFFTDAVSSGISYNISQAILKMIDKTSFVLYKLLELLDNMNEGINLSPSGVSLNEIMEMYKQISKLLSEMIEEGETGEKLSKLEELLKEAIQKAKGLESRNPGDGKAREIREKLEDILSKVKDKKLQLAYDKVKNVEFNLLEYQKGMFEKGLSEKREAEKPKEYKTIKVQSIILNNNLETIKDSFIRKRYAEVINKYKKILSR